MTTDFRDFTQRRACIMCGGYWSMADNAVIHKHDCPTMTKIDKPEAQEPDDGHIVASLGAKRFEKAEKPGQAQAFDAIEQAMAAYRDDPATHIIVIMSKDYGDGATNTRFFNAGTMNSLAQYGMMTSALDLMLRTQVPR